MGAETAIIATGNREPKIEKGRRECSCRKVPRAEERKWPLEGRDHNL
jgi:hypothetical protein